MSTKISTLLSTPSVAGEKESFGEVQAQVGATEGECGGNSAAPSFLVVSHANCKRHDSALGFFNWCAGGAVATYLDKLSLKKVRAKVRVSPQKFAAAKFRISCIEHRISGHRRSPFFENAQGQQQKSHIAHIGLEVKDSFPLLIKIGAGEMIESLLGRAGEPCGGEKTRVNHAPPLRMAHEKTVVADRDVGAMRGKMAMLIDDRENDDGGGGSF